MKENENPSEDAFDAGETKQIGSEGGAERDTAPDNEAKTDEDAADIGSADCVLNTELTAEAGDGGTEQNNAYPVLLAADDIPDNGPELENKEDAAKGGEGRAKPKSVITLRRIVSFLMTLFFCGAAVIYFAAQAAVFADKLSADSLKSLLLEEVFGDFETVSDTEQPYPAADTEPDTKEEEEEEEEPAVHEDAPPELPTEEGVPEYPIEPETLANFDLLSDLSNETSYEPELPKLLSEKRGVGKCEAIYKKYGDSAPVVLIIHTHGTEAYAEEGMDTYDETYPFRSCDVDRNVVSVGDTVAKVLEYEGINTIHCTQMFDEESYRDSYAKSRAATARYLDENPSIAYVFDIHRDSVFRDDKTNIKTLALFNGESIAQVMTVVGTDEGGADHKTWEDNLSLALNIQSSMMSYSETMPRKINLRSAAFNQGLSSGSLLLEIGSCGNTLSEAKKSAVLCAVSLAEAIKGERVSDDPAELISLFAE